MAKRKHTDAPPDHNLYNKRSRLNQADDNDDAPTSQAKIDPTYGQRGAFPGLDDSEDGLFYGPASDGMEYLRMVRSEAKTVPNLLVAPSSPSHQTQTDDLYGDYPQGYYADGAYTALPFPSSNGAHGSRAEGEDLDPQEAYYASLCARFEQLSSVLKTSYLPLDQTLAGQPLSWYNSSHWRSKILKTTPQTIRLAQLPQDMVIRGLEVLETVLNSANLRSAKGKNIGAWAWGLLGRCREVGQMGSEEVAVLRSLGKRAVWLLRRIAAGEAVGGEKEPGDDEEDGEIGEEEGEDEEDGEIDEEEGKHEEDGEIGEGKGEHEAEGKDDLINGEEGMPSNGDESTTSLPELARINGEKDNALEEVRNRMLTTLDSTAKEETELGNINMGKNAQTQRADEQESRLLSEMEAEVSVQVMSEAATANDAESVHATLDMLVTIIGEFYGQRDLLDGRLLWDEIESS